MSMKRLLCALLLTAMQLAYSQTAMPARPTTGSEVPAKWIRIAGSDRLTVYMDMSTIRPQGQYVKAWLLWKMSDPKGAPSGRYSYQSYKELGYVHCGDRTSSSKQIVYYDDDVGLGNVVNSIEMADNEMLFSDPVPGSLGESLIATTCRVSKRP